MHLNNNNRGPYNQNGGDNRNNKKRLIIISLLCAIVALFIGLCIVAACIIHEHNHTYGYGSGGGGGGGVASSSNIANSNDINKILANIARINGGSLPEITCNGEGIPVFIDGKFSEVVVQNYSTALMAISEIKGLMQISNPVAEFVGSDIYELNGSRIFKLRQVVSGVPVYDKELVIETGQDGKVKALCCDYSPGIDISTVAKTDKQSAERAILDNGDGFSKVYSDELCVYSLAGDPVLTWCIDVGTDEMPEKRFFVSAQDNSFVSAIDLHDYEDAAGKDVKGVTRNFSVTHNDDGYSLIDEQRGISVYKCDGTRTGQIAKSADNSWDDPELVTAAANIRDIYDCYKEICAPAFRKNQLAKIDVMTSYRKHNTALSNAMCVMRDGGASIIFGDGSHYGWGMDIAAHEFTHAVIRSMCDLTPINEPGAICEAYCDIMGVLVRNIKTGSNDWRMGTELTTGVKRNLSNPNRTKQPSKIHGSYEQSYCTKKHDHTLENCDNGGIHINNGIMCRAAYLMYKNGISDQNELLKIFGTSLNYLVPTSDYKTCRAAVIHAAKQCGVSEEKIRIISDAFKSVGIVNDTQLSFTEDDGAANNVKGIITGKVEVAGGHRPIPSARINMSAMNGTGGEINTETNTDGVFNKDANAGLYKVNVSKNGYRSCIINNVSISEGNTTYLQNTILLQEVTGNPLSKAGGRITNAVSGDPVRGAVVRFISDWGSVSGDYVKDADNNKIELITDENGSFYTDKLTYGYFTAEVTMPGFATQHVNMIASTDANISSAQDVVLAPQTSGNDYRVTLEWGNAPLDEDAHIKGDSPIDFHVYYSNKEALYNEKSVAKLDHDDRNGNGFETITFTISDKGTYKYFIHNFSGEAMLANSNARVKLYRGNVMVEQYNVPINQQNGDYWNVFRIENGRVISINEIINSEP